jgi:hypothetical protein
VREFLRVLTIDAARSFAYQSVYFDTCDHLSYLSAARRRPRRFKVRTRSYIDSGLCVIEVKVRDARGNTIKHRRPYDFSDRFRLTDDACAFVATIEQAALAAGQLHPALTTAYQRTTLVLPKGSARVTIDVDLAWTHPDQRRAELSDIGLIETKTAGPPSTIDRALWRRGHRPTIISKYCTGLAALTPQLPANKWTRVLRRHFRNGPDADSDSPAMRRTRRFGVGSPGRTGEPARVQESLVRGRRLRRRRRACDGRCRRGGSRPSARRR